MLDVAVATVGMIGAVSSGVSIGMARFWVGFGLYAVTAVIIFGMVATWG